MRFDVITLFPELFEPFLRVGVTRRAYETRQVDVRLWNPRDFAEGHYRRVDDRPFGGGPGMVMLAEPLHQCLQAIRADRGEPESDGPSLVRDEEMTGGQDGRSFGGLGDGAVMPSAARPFIAPVVLFSPFGQTLTHAAVQGWSDGQGAILLCGRYEGVDQRFIDCHVTHQISLGDFVLSGGEIAAMALLDAVARLQPGVLNDEGSHQLDSFNPALDGLLDSPHYTRPEVWQGQAVPLALLSGHHARIERWRREQSLRLTQAHRPALIEQARKAGRLDKADEIFLAGLSGQHAGTHDPDR